MPPACWTQTEIDATIAACWNEIDDVNLLTWWTAQRHPGEVNKYFQRHQRLIGELDRTKALYKILGWLAAVSITLIIGLYYDDTIPWWFKAPGALLIMVFGVIYAWELPKYGLAFVKAYINERADPTDKTYVTNHSTIMLPRPCFADRPDVWRGNAGRSGMSDKEAYVVLAAGQDKVYWHKGEHPPPPEADEKELQFFSSIPETGYGDWDKDIWCDVRPGPRIDGFRLPSEYRGLPSDPYTATGIPYKARRAWLRESSKTGALKAKLQKERFALLDGRWPWIAGLGCVAAGFLLLVIVTGG